MSTALQERKTLLFDKLNKAVLLELSTLPPYLTAMWSLHPGSNREAAAVLRSVLMEEMLHMTLAANVLSAVGGCACLQGDRLPGYPLALDFAVLGHPDRTVEMHLERFSESAVRTFMQIEQPANLPSPLAHATGHELVLDGLSIGQFYLGIEAELARLCEDFGDAAVFSGNPGHQVSAEHFWKGGGRPVVVCGLKDALRAIDVIRDQGEGAKGSLSDGDACIGQPEEVAHYFRFKQIVAGRYYAPTDKASDEPSGPPLAVDFAAVFPIKPDCRRADFAADPELTALSDSFNAGYSMMLWQLMEGFGGNPAVFYTATMNGMVGLGEIARAMVQVPIRGDGQRRHASPTFEWHPAGAGLPSSAAAAD